MFIHFHVKFDLQTCISVGVCPYNHLVVIVLRLLLEIMTFYLQIICVSVYGISIIIFIINSLYKYHYQVCYSGVTYFLCLFFHCFLVVHLKIINPTEFQLAV